MLSSPLVNSRHPQDCKSTTSPRGNLVYSDDMYYSEYYSEYYSRVYGAGILVCSEIRANASGTLACFEIRANARLLSFDRAEKYAWYLI